MKQIELSKDVKLEELVKRVPREDIVLTAGGRVVALLSEFDEDDLQWYQHERDPAFIESLFEAREQAEQGEKTSLTELKRELGIRESFESFLWKEVYRLLANGKNGEKPWARLRRLCLELVDKKREPLFREHFRKKNCTIRYEKISRSTLKKLITKKRAGHDEQPPKRTDEPIIVVAHKNKKYLVDGKRRRVFWLKEKTEGPFPAIIITFSL